jgi:Flp pilus assembly protein TadB
MMTKQPHGPPMTLSNVRAEPDLQEHKRPINHALTRKAARRVVGHPANDNASPWQWVVFGAALLIVFVAAAGAALVALVAAVAFLQ